MAANLGGSNQLVVTVNSSQAINGLNQILGAMNRLANYSQTMTTRLTAGFTALTRSIWGVVAGFVGFHAIRQATRYVSAFLGELIEVNRAFTGFIASMRVIKGSVESAGKEYEFLVSISNRLGIALENSISQYHRLAASLKNVDTTGQLTRHLFSGLSQAAVVLHSRGRDVTLIFEAVQQMASKGKLSLEELQRQLGNTLPGAVGLAARSMMGSESFIEAGVKNAAEAEQLLRKQIERGTINVYEFLARFSNQLKIEYADGVAYASTQFTANFNRMKNAVIEFYRVVGNSGAMQGLTILVNKVSELLSVASKDGGAATMLGQALGESFERIAAWSERLDSKSVVEFLLTIGGGMRAAMVVVEEFMSAFKGIGDTGMKTPILDFVAFVAESMAGLVDTISAAVVGIRMLLNSLQRAWLDTKQFFTSGMGIAEPLVNAVDSFGNMIGVKIPGRAGRDVTRNTQADIRAAKYQNSVEYANLVGRGEDAFSPTRSAHGRTSAIFDGIRSDYLRTTGPQVNIPNFNVQDIIANRASGSAQTFSGLGSRNYSGLGGLPEFLRTNSAGVADAYVDPQNPNDFNAMLKNILENSSAPNSAKSGGRTAKDPVQSNFMREQTRLIKEMAVAETEYQNVLENRNRKEGVNEAQMRSLIQTDERYISLSGDKQARLMSLARSLDEMNLRVDNAIKAQDAYNESMQRGFDVADRIQEITSGGFQSQYRALSDLMNSFREGGDNEFMDSANRQRMIMAAMRQDAADRNLDMAEFSASIRQANDDLLFQANLFGRSTLEQQKLIAFRQIDLDIAKMSVGATQEQMLAYQQLAAILKGEVLSAINEVHAKTQDMASGIQDAITRYMDEVSNKAKEWGDVATNALGNMEDALVSFAETGKLSFSDLIRSMAQDLVRLIARMVMLWALQQMTGMASRNYSDNGGYGSLAGMGDFSLPNEHGNAFGAGGLHKFAKGSAFTNKIYGQPTYFRFGKGGQFLGQMGEAGDEAVVPLVRTSSGDLGVQSVGGGGNSESYLNLKIEVYQGEGNGVSSEMASDGQGDILRVFVGENARDVRRGGEMAKAIEETYGLSRKPKSVS